ncbi:Hypothetical predicted protein [Olea europaea subsp. europaea]|uniref:Uncharacterized protein n=1 Tax=Olea europaea subsp. europaea TaxID=158383 RepID=A0A8S0RRV2_OLEEU|nr:Hypothetical predicted protein [Olea europaea subsp. europaea]
MVAPVSNCGPSVFHGSPAKGAIATAEGPGKRLWGLRSRRRSKARGQWGALGGAGYWKKIASAVRRLRERSQSRRDRASDCGVRVVLGDRKGGAGGERLEGGIGKKIASAARRYYSRPSTLNFGALMGSGALVQSSVGSDSNCGGTGPAIVGSAEPVAIESEGPAGSAWRDGIGEKNCFKGEKVLMGSGALVLVWSHQSVIAVRAYLMSVLRRERSQPWRDRASDCGVRGARGNRKRGASGERLEGRDRGKKLLQRREG